MNFYGTWYEWYFLENNKLIIFDYDTSTELFYDFSITGDVEIITISNNFITWDLKVKELNQNSLITEHIKPSEPAKKFVYYFKR